MKEYFGYDAELYDAYVGMEDDVPFYVEMARNAKWKVLEIACGTGRVLIPSAEAGAYIWGVDFSLDMLNLAKQKVAELSSETQKRITLSHGNMRTFELEHKYNLITIPFRAFFHMLTVDDQVAALISIHKHLADDGRLIFNIWDPSIEIIAEHGESLGQSLKMFVKFKHPVTGNRVVGWGSRNYMLTEQILEETRLFDELNEAGKVINRYYVPLQIRWVYRYEMQHLLELCGFEVEALYGDFKRANSGTVASKFGYVGKPSRQTVSIIVIILILDVNLH